ncbi:hypothetical protein SAMN06265171_105292 [Chryseobacterium rhizoplanae]|uniref:Uncharacterized protein n=1 Tax=Chryseobacterium rhizoplanae TaxID=1609531 RepID=A0A521DMF6_9FLAO|nr:hypothetical protein [Chryseobacterium rhizoplanae]SMO72887.1 hypothetical protein SAMN06265171_105292 [Chryseobacterium rhizoplanae]
MKKKIFFFLIILIYSVTACEQPGKTKLFKAEKQIHSNHIIKNVYLDDQFAEDEMEVILNNTTNTVTIHLDGETHELKKSIDLPEYTAENSEYRYTDINGEITFLNRNLDMIVFHHTAEPKRQKKLRKVSY